MGPRESAAPEGLTTQWLRGVLDLCLMAVVAEQPAYGYEMTRRLRLAGLDLVADGSIYPALARLERQGRIDSFRVPSDEGPARKYYRITADGSAALKATRLEWASFTASVARVLDLDVPTPHLTEGTP
jgi:PadR family transcriptional regulator PadR